LQSAINTYSDHIKVVILSLVVLGVVFVIGKKLLKMRAAKAKA